MEIKFNQDEEKYIFEQLGRQLCHMASVRWDIPVDVFDLNSNEKHQLHLRKKSVDGTFGFFDDWNEKIVLRRKFKAKE
ncbi:hypothetical protein ACSBR2_009637 [Camellia fascicularis]